jgi:hypothetical protein
MERELWRWIVRGLKRLPRWWPRGAVYDNRVVLAVLLWAALHDRSVTWACQRSNWPVQAWRRRLPDQSTMSRRLRDPRVLDDIERLTVILQRPVPTSPTVIVDGKPLPVSVFTADKEAKLGWGAGRHAWGYKLHALIDGAQRLLAWVVHPMNHAESTAARELLERAARHGQLIPGAVMIGDASYDSNPLYAAASALGMRLIAPRRRPGRGLSPSFQHHPDRLTAIAYTECDPSSRFLLRSVRTQIERYFGSLATVGGGLMALPAWARRLHRVRAWVGAKLAVNAARAALRWRAVA